MVDGRATGWTHNHVFIHRQDRDRKVYTYRVDAERVTKIPRRTHPGKTPTTTRNSTNNKESCRKPRNYPETRTASGANLFAVGSGTCIHLIVPTGVLVSGGLKVEIELCHLNGSGSEPPM